MHECIHIAVWLVCGIPFVHSLIRLNSVWYFSSTKRFCVWKSWTWAQTFYSRANWRDGCDSPANQSDTFIPTCNVHLHNVLFVVCWRNLICCAWCARVCDNKKKTWKKGNRVGVKAQDKVTNKKDSTNLKQDRNELLSLSLTATSKHC